MKMTKLILSAGLLVVIVFASCKKVINITETDLIAGDLALKTVTNVEQAVIGAYGTLATEMDILFNAVTSDELQKGDFYNAQEVHEWQYNATSVTIRDNYTAIHPLYRVADRANRVLAALPKADSTVAGDIVKKNRLRGEALFLRAFAHFQLFRYYSDNYDPAGQGMPYIETVDLAPRGRIGLGAYYAKIMQDIRDAIPLLPNNLTDRNRATQAAGNALLARAALYMRDWATAEAAATAVITAQPLSSRSVFPTIWTDAATGEVVYQMVRNNANRIGNLFRTTASGSSPTQIQTITWRPSNALWASYDQVNDVRFAAYLIDEPTLGTTAPIRGTRLIRKYAGSGYGTANENVNNAKIFRTGEMYLIRAEARAEQNKITGSNSAESDINELRTNRINAYVNVVFSTKQEAIDAIMLERFKELPFEGHRLWDLKRRNLPVVRTGADIPISTAATLAAGSRFFKLPIPLSELQANPVLGQSSGY
jgi:starch-binding outer membrane protein, SusD/RagB family